MFEIINVRVWICKIINIKRIKYMGLFYKVKLNDYLLKCKRINNVVTN